MEHRGNDGPSHVSIEKIGQWGVGDVRTDPITVGHESKVRHRGLVLSFSDRTGDATIIPYDLNGIFIVLTYMCLTQIPSKLAMLQHLFLEF